MQLFNLVVYFSSDGTLGYLLFAQRIRISVPEVIKLEFILKLKIKRNDWLLADTYPQVANHCALFGVWTVIKFYILGA